MTTMGLSNYPPGVSGNEPQITGENVWDRPNPETSRSGPDAPGFILFCCGCGEEFDALQPAVNHIMDGMAGNHDCDEETTFQIMPEEMSSTREPEDSNHQPGGGRLFPTDRRF